MHMQIVSTFCGIQSNVEAYKIIEQIVLHNTYGKHCRLNCIDN